jgi:NADH-quinone oxidoreductase subunit N
MGVQSVDWVALGPALAPAVAALLVLALDAALGRRRPGVGTLLDAVAVLGVLGGLAAVLPLTGGTRRTFCVAGGSCAYAASPLTVALQVMVLLSAFVCLLLALGDGPRRARVRPEPLPGSGKGANRAVVRDDASDGSRPELLLLLLTATSGACALAGARELATLAVALETASLPVVGLVGLRRDGRGAEGAVKLLLTSVLSFGLLVLGAALVYASTGTLRLGAPVSERLGDLTAVHGVGLALVVAGAAFKLSMVPFHLWTPEAYAGAPLPVAAFLATTSKVAGLTAVVLVLVVGAPDRAAAWAPPVGLLAAVTMTVGNLVALRQQSAVRLLAWSTVAQAGWVVLPLGGAVRGGVNGAVTASVAYLLAYVVASLTAFAVVVRMARTVPDGARHRLDAYAGLWRRDPVTALVLAFALLCLAGLPPGVMGLVAKVVALVPVVGVQAWGLAAAAVVNAVLGIAVYLRWAAYLAGSPRPAQGNVPPPTAAEAAGASSSSGPLATSAPKTQPRTQRLALALAAAGCLALSVLPEGLIAVLGGSASP